MVTNIDSIRLRVHMENIKFYLKIEGKTSTGSLCIIISRVLDSCYGIKTKNLKLKTEDGYDILKYFYVEDFFNDNDKAYVEETCREKNSLFFIDTEGHDHFKKKEVGGRDLEPENLNGFLDKATSKVQKNVEDEVSSASIQADANTAKRTKYHPIETETFCGNEEKKPINVMKIFDENIKDEKKPETCLGFDEKERCSDIAEKKKDIKPLSSKIKKKKENDEKILLEKKNDGKNEDKKSYKEDEKIEESSEEKKDAIFEPKTIIVKVSDLENKELLRITNGKHGNTFLPLKKQKDDIEFEDMI